MDTVNHTGRWIEEGTKEQGEKKYLGRKFKVASGNSGGYRIVEVVEVENYAGLIMPFCKTISKHGDAKHARFEKCEAIHSGR